MVRLLKDRPSREAPLMSDCATSKMRFETQTALALEAAFDGGRITSDGGLLWLAQTDSQLGLCEAISEHVPEWRKRKGCHSLSSLVRSSARLSDSLWLRRAERLELLARRPFAQAGVRISAREWTEPRQPADYLTPGERRRRSLLLPNSTSVP